jgi:hypothetical protein
MAHGPLQPAQALLYSKPETEDKRSSPTALLRFVRPPSVSPDPRDIIQAPDPCDVIKTLDPFTQLLLRSTSSTVTRCRRYAWARRVAQDHLGTCNA